MGLIRVYWVILLILACQPLAAEETLPKVTIPVSENLAADGNSANQQKLPIMLFFAQEDCPYCEIMRESYLKPMMRSGMYKDKVLIRMIMIDSYGDVKDFNGQTIDIDTFTDRYNADLTPTLAFVDATGKELAPRLVGLGNEYFFAGEIDSAIDTALEKVRH